MFPPPKKPAGPGGPPPKSGLPGPGGPPPGPGGPPPGGDPFGPAPAGGPAMPPGMDPFGGGAMPPLGMGAGMPKPGQGMDPMMAMMQGLGPDPFMSAGAPPSQGPPMGPDGFPVGGSMPPPGGDMGGSDLLQALAGGMGGGDIGADISQLPPGAPDQMFQGIGQGDPSMGLQQMLQMLALGQMGVGGGPASGGSGMDLGGGQIGSALGF